MSPIAWANAILFLPALVSLYGGLHNTSLPRHFQDFQWSGTYLTLHHIDPYHQYLIGDPEHLILFAQIPNYLHELYIFLLPLGLLKFTAVRPVWTLMNCLFTVAIILLLSRFYVLDRARTLLLTLLLLLSTPFRITIAAGTESLLELLAFCLVFYSMGRFQRGIALGFSYFKYSFSPVLVLYLFFRRQYKLLAISLLPPLIGLLLMWLFVGGSPVTLALEPLRVSRTGVTPGFANIMSLVPALFANLFSVSVIAKMIYLLPIAASIGYSFFLSRQNDLSPQQHAAILSVASLMFFVHLSYDLVFLVVPLAASLAGPLRRANTLILAIIGFIWYAVKVFPGIDRLAVATAVSTAAFFLLAVILVQLQSIQLQNIDTGDPALITS